MSLLKYKRCIPIRCWLNAFCTKYFGRVILAKYIGRMYFHSSSHMHLYLVLSYYHLPEILYVHIELSSKEVQEYPPKGAPKRARITSAQIKRPEYYRDKRRSAVQIRLLSSFSNHLELRRRYLLVIFRLCYTIALKLSTNLAKATKYQACP